MDNLNKISREVVDVCNTLKASVDKLETKILIPEYRNISKEDKERVDKEMGKFIDNLEMPDLKGDLAKFMQNKK